MQRVEDILNGKYFPVGSRERLKATLISLMLLLAILIMIIDVYESIMQRYFTMSVIESGTALAFMIVYFLFPHKISLAKTINITLLMIAFLFIVSLTIHGANPQFALFWLATLPVYIFFFLGLERGKKWTVVAIFFLILTTINAIFEWHPPLYRPEFLLQLTVAYLVISYLLYSLEKERQGYEKSLLSAIKDKETLLKEVHHRTKNNMQIMIGLLETQSFKINDAKYKKMFQSHVERLQSMALVHKHLYGGSTYETVEIDKYLEEIAQNMQRLSSHTILTDIEPFVLDMRTAMNLGLIFNEALLNAIEHAYKEDETGEIEISLKRTDKKCLLTVKDYGQGFDAQKEYHTLGMTLMKDLSRSLDDKCMEINIENGTEIKIYCTLEGNH